MKKTLSALLLFFGLSVSAVASASPVVCTYSGSDLSVAPVSCSASVSSTGAVLSENPLPKWSIPLYFTRETKYGTTGYVNADALSYLFVVVFVTFLLAVSLLTYAYFLFDWGRGLAGKKAKKKP